MEPNVLYAGEETGSPTEGMYLRVDAFIKGKIQWSRVYFVYDKDDAHHGLLNAIDKFKLLSGLTFDQFHSISIIMLMDVLCDLIPVRMIISPNDDIETGISVELGYLSSPIYEAEAMDMGVIPEKAALA